MHECACVCDRASERVCVCMHMHKGQTLQPRIAWNSLYIQLKFKFIVVLLAQFRVWDCGHEPLGLTNFCSFVDVLRFPQSVSLV